MSDDRKYSYRVIMTPVEAQVRSTERMGRAHGYNPSASLDVKGATYHRIFDEANPTRDPVGLIECADGSVFTYEDMRGMWDPKDAEVELLESTAEALHTTESDFFARQLAEIDTRVYATRYAYGEGEMYPYGGGSAYPQVECAPDPTLWCRFVYAVWRVRQWVGFAIAGYQPGEDDD